MSGTLRAYHKTPEDEDSRLGQVIDCYRLVRRIATGGMGTVYEAVHIHLGRRYAMKVLNQQLQGNAQATARFIAEGQAANQPTGQGVVAVHDVGRAENGSIYILMEYLEGETLSDRIAGTFGRRDARPGDSSALPLPEQPDEEYLVRSLRLAKQLASTLKTIHRSGVIHRDLKPDNVFVIQDAEAIGGERVKILDFGIAKVIAPVGQRQTSPVTWAPTLQRTVLGTVLGTPTYMAPEQWRGDGQADERTDTYGLGAILFEIFAGRPPFTAKLIGDLMAQHCTEEAPALAAVAPWTPAGLSELVRQMLAKDLRSRPTMQVVSQRLTGILADFVGEELPSRSPLKQVRALLHRLRKRAAGRGAGPARLATPLRVTAAMVTVSAALTALILLMPRSSPLEIPPAQPAPHEKPTAALRIESQPVGAKVYWSDGTDEDESLDSILKPFCRTPCNLLPAASDSGFVILTRRGYRSRRIPLKVLAKAAPGTIWHLESWPPHGNGKAGGASARAPVRLAVMQPRS